MATTALKPAALMSYTRSDDDYSRGYLSELSAWISREVQAYTGHPFPIFRDPNDMAWGQHWAERITHSLDAQTLLIPILTPSFFMDEWCRRELERFLQREAELHRNDLVVPVYFIRIPALETPDPGEQDPLIRAISTRQLIDWRSLRLEPLSNPEAQRRLGQIVEQIVAVLESSETSSGAPDASP